MSGFQVGQTVQLNDGGRLAIVRYAGQPDFAPGEWIGVELEDDSGKNDGSVKGQRYFECDMGRGMFLRPTAVKIVEQPAPKVRTQPAKRLSRPSSVTAPGATRRMSSVPDAAAGKRMSINAASPTPAVRTRPSSLIRSPTKSPTKQLSATSSKAPTPRTRTPSNAQTTSTSMAKPQPGARPNRTSSMGPPAAPAVRGSRQSLASGLGLGNHTSVPPSRTASSRPSLAPKDRLRTGSDRIASIGSQLSGGQISEDGARATGDEDRSDRSVGNDSFSPKTLSPPMSRVSITDRQTASPASSQNTASPVTQRTGGASTAVTREIESLKAKLRVMEGKRMEDRQKLKEMEKHQSDKEIVESHFKKFQAKLAEQTLEVTELRRQLKESGERFEEVESLQAEHEVVLEMATLDREMAEETADVLRTELNALRLKAEELELEVEILREENTELGGEMTPEEKSSHGWLQIEASNRKLREAVILLRDQMVEDRSSYTSEIADLQKEVRELASVKEIYESAKERLAQAETVIEDLRQQLDNALGAEDMIEELTEKNMAMSEHIEELKVTIEDLESLKEVNDELEINHIETEKDMQEDIDFKDSVISEQARRATQQDAALEDMEYTLSRFRELVMSLQSDLDDMRASHAVTETESELLNSRSRAMMDLNMKLQVSAAKTQVKTIDLELRRLDAQEASEHLSIVQMFLPETYHADKNSVLALLRFKRVGFKADLLHNFVKERVNNPSFGHEENTFLAFEVLDKLSWVAAMCDCFVNALNSCSTDEFAKFEGALYELEPVERALNSWIDGLRRDELKESQCASELQRTIALMSHLAEVHIPQGLASYADDVHMRTLLMQSHLENAAAALSCSRTMVQTAIPTQGDESEHAQHFSRKTESVIASTRSAKVVIGKAVRALKDLKNRSLSLTPDTIQIFEQCETATKELANFSRQVGLELCTLLHEEGRTESFTYLDIQNVIHGTTTSVFASSESDLFSAYSNKLRTLTTALVDLAALASDLEMTQEFERAPAPWVLRSQQLKSSKVVTVDAEDEMRRLKDNNLEHARNLAIKDQTLEEATVKIELLESRMRDAAKKTERIIELEKRIEEAKKRESELSESLETQNKELATLDTDREKWRKAAEDAKALGIAAPGSKAGQERAVATAREMDALKNEIESLQAAVRFLREDNRRVRLADPSGLDWLSAPLTKPKSKDQQRQELVISEGRDILNELLNLAATAKVFDLSTMPKDRLAWRPAKTTPKYHVARQKEDYAAWGNWKRLVIDKAHVLTELDANRGLPLKTSRKPAVQVAFRLPDLEDKGMKRGGEVEIVNPDDFEEFRGRLGFV